jgi:hypothetical protein
MVLERDSSNLAVSQSVIQSTQEYFQYSQSLERVKYGHVSRGTRNKNGYAGKGQQQFSRQTVHSVFSCGVSSRYLATTSEQTEGFTYAVFAVNCRVCKTMRLIQLLVVTIYKCSRNAIVNPKPVSSH